MFAEPHRSLQAVRPRVQALEHAVPLVSPFLRRPAAGARQTRRGWGYAADELMHLADYWWDAGRKPYRKMKTLGERLKLRARQVRRYIAELQTAGLLKQPVPMTVGLPERFPG
jgi:hypothetical protein